MAQRPPRKRLSQRMAKSVSTFLQGQLSRLREQSCIRTRHRIHMREDV
jgi:hypothetical protein